jgi:hypothetical protein
VEVVALRQLRPCPAGGAGVYSTGTVRASVGAYEFIRVRKPGVVRNELPWENVKTDTTPTGLCRMQGGLNPVGVAEMVVMYPRQLVPRNLGL